MLKTGTVLGGRYGILNLIGTGGMAEVYKAMDEKLQRLVAVKVLKAEYGHDEGFVAKFRKEAQAAGCLNHPNVVGVYDVGSQGDLHYIVMELVEGVTLKTYIERKGRLTEREAVEVGIQVSRGIDAAHKQGIIHRDIKPQNIVISREGKIKVTDFGIARISGNETATVGSMGSVHYISPEQARGGYCDERSDIYSLGISLYEMVTGVVPFTGDSSVAVALQHIQGELTPPSAYAPELSVNLENIILKCTQKKPEYRYASMSALLEDFRRLLTTPEEDFVELPDPNAAPLGDTTVLKEEELGTLRRAGGSEVAAAGARRLGRSEEETIRMKQREEDLLEEQKAMKTERRLKYIVLAAAIVILMLIIALVIRSIVLLQDNKITTEASTAATGSSEEQPSEAPTEAEETTESNLPAENVLPSLLGMNYQDAVELIESLGFQPDYQVGTTGGYEPFTVCDQSYPAGTLLKRGTVVTIWISIDSSNSVIIPSTLVGLTQSEVRQKLKSLGLSVVGSVLEDYSDSVPRGYVMNTDPAVGSVVDRGSSVQIIISRGATGFRMPDLDGLSVEKATERFYSRIQEEDRWFFDSYIEFVDRASTRNAGEIVGQSVKENTYITYEDYVDGTIPEKIEIYVSNGETPAYPEEALEGKLLAEAVTLLKQMGFKVETSGNQTIPEESRYVQKVTLKGQSESLKPAAAIAEGSELTVYFTDTPPVATKFALPSLIGKDFNEAYTLVYDASEKVFGERTDAYNMEHVRQDGETVAPTAQKVGLIYKVTVNGQEAAAGTMVGETDDIVFYFYKSAPAETEPVQPTESTEQTQASTEATESSAESSAESTEASSEQS